MELWGDFHRDALAGLRIPPVCTGPYDFTVCYYRNKKISCTILLIKTQCTVVASRERKSVEVEGGGLRAGVFFICYCSPQRILS